MELTEIRAEGLQRAYEAVAAAAEIESKIDAKIEEVRPTAQLKGFRKGKVPRDLLKKMFGKSMLAEVTQQLVDTTLQEHLQASGHRPASQPQVTLVNEDFEAGHDLKVKFEYELMPDIPELALSEIALERLTVTVGDEEIDKTLETLASNAKTFEAKEGAAETGDQVAIDFIGRIDGEAFEGGSGEDFPLELGAGRFIPGFEDQLVGATAGETRDVNVSFPDDYGAAELAGKPAVFEVTVKEVRGAKAAEIDDALAERYGAEDLTALRGQIVERLSNEYRTASRAHLKRRLLDTLSDRLEFPAPEGMVGPEAGTIAHQLWHEANPEVEGHDHPTIEPTEEHRVLALRRVRLGLYIADVGAKNEIQVSEQEIANAAAMQARQYQGQEKQVYDFIMKDPRMKQQLSGPIFEDKVVDYIFELATVTEKEVTADELREALKALDDEDEARKPAAPATPSAAEPEPSEAPSA